MGLPAIIPLHLGGYIGIQSVEADSKLLCCQLRGQASTGISGDNWSQQKVVKMEGGKNGKWSKWKVVKMESGQNEKWSK